ncbi:MAG TPA: hypothetical protein VF721_18170 [Pyrinomonadaceae bacterium]|jgi:predicted Na+-dependent transporter
MIFLTTFFLLLLQTSASSTENFTTWANINWKTIACAFGGGLAIKLLDLLERNNLPADRRPTLDLFFWAAFIILPLLGAFVAWAYDDGNNINSMLAIQIGASAPLILKSLAAAVPPT